MRASGGAVTRTRAPLHRLSSVGSCPSAGRRPVASMASAISVRCAKGAAKKDRAKPTSSRALGSAYALERELGGGGVYIATRRRNRTTLPR